MKLSNIIVGFCTSITLAVFVIIMGNIYNCTPDRLFFAIDKFEIAKNDITIGENSDIVFENVPPDFMTVHFEKDSVRWNINDSFLNTDSLQYIKINNDNPNNITLSENSVINVNNQFSINYQQIAEINKNMEAEKRFRDRLSSKKVRYFALRNILAHNATDSNQIDTLPKWKNLKSLICISEDNEISLIILDKYTSLSQNGQTIRYKNSGKVGGSEIKIQFYNMIENIAKFNEIDSASMFVGDINYFAKPRVKTTAWGAGHIKIKKLQNGRFEITFPKAISLSESYSSLDSMISKSGGEIQIKQYQTAFPTQNDIYIPEFSNALQTEIANVQKREGQDKIHICYFGTDGIHSKELTNKFSLLPKIENYTSDFGNGNKVHFRARNLNANFYVSAFLWILIVGVIAILGLIFFFRSVLKVQTNEERIDNLYSEDKAKTAWQYIAILFSIFIAFMCCKIFVATKLSYTYPFFEKVYSSAILSAWGQITLLYLLLILINFAFTQNLFTAQKNSYKIGVPIITMLGIPALFGGIGWFVAKPYLLQNFGGDIFNSYLTDSKFDNSFLNGQAIKDNLSGIYNSVFSAILLVFTVLIIASLFAYIWKDKFYKLSFSRININNIWIRIFCVFVVALSIFIMKLFGNFAKTGVTLLFVIGISWNWHFDFFEKFKKNKIKNWVAIILLLSSIILAIFFAGFVDAGYLLTSFIGIVVFCFICWILRLNEKIGIDKSGDEKEHLQKSSKKKSMKYAFLLTVSVIIGSVLLLPKIFPVEKVDYDRSARRSALFTNFNDVQSTGYRYNESDAEFMVVLSHYMHGDTLKNNDIMSENYQLHPSVSTGQSPVVLNDVSFPAAFYSPLKGAPFVFFGLLAALLLLAFWFNIWGIKEFKTEGPKLLHIRMRWRLLAVCIWVFTSLYLFVSYFGFVPFTGRLIPGYGVDAVGEALETVILFTFMGAMMWQRPENDK